MCAARAPRAMVIHSTIGRFSSRMLLRRQPTRLNRHRCRHSAHSSPTCSTAMPCSSFSEQKTKLRGVDMTTNLTEEGLIKVPGLLSRWVRLGNGAKAHYMTAGETGPSVMLLHGGIPGSSGTAGFRFTASFLGANGFRV